ncbi:MAG: hypothetical protein II457_04045, partial [Paludibacteraceae bacterium]|nr:hypothetical protein [Paludibacteraceae bacterium]
MEKIVLTPKQPSYIFPPMDYVSHQIKFTLSKVRVWELHDIDDHVLGEELLSSVDETASLHLGPGECSFTGGTYFRLGEVRDTFATVITQLENKTGADYDTLVVRTSATVGGTLYTDIEARVPLMQTAMELEKVVWSVDENGNRYFIMAGSGGLIYRQFEPKDNTLYKKEDGMTQLIEGSANAANDQTEYITPWNFVIPEHGVQQVKFHTEFGVNKNFIINGSSDPDLADIGVGEGASILTYQYVTENFNDNGNFEEVVKIKYGPNKWLKFNATLGSESLTLTDDSTKASTFSWTYLKPEYYLLNNDVYPSRDHLEFGYNKLTISSVTTRYKAYRIYSMLVDNELT